MRYRVLGSTGLHVSILGFGASPLGGAFGDIDEAEGVRAVHEALDRGVNFFDVSPYYGLTRAESVLGRALGKISRDRYVLATKVGRYGEAAFGFSAHRVARSIDESLRRLRVDYVDLIQCHDIEYGDLDQIVDETIPALRRLQEQGKVRFVGITGLPLAIFHSVLPRVEVDTILSYCHHTLADSSLMDLLPFLHRHQVGVINASPLAMGLLTDEGPPSWHPAPAEVRHACAAAASWCRNHGKDVARLALQHALEVEGIHTTLIGMASREHVERNVQAAEEPADQEAIRQVMAILAPLRNMTWQSGRPENAAAASRD
jgi:L-galactose dehydrogenase